MKLVYYNAKIGNIGDDLNPWLWEKLLNKDFFLEDNMAFLGVGSIISNKFDLFNNTSSFDKIFVFGSGVRSIDDNFDLSKNYKIIFSRGPYSSYKLTNSFENYISDAAYAIMLLEDYQEMIDLPKKYKVSYIPYFRSFEKVDWQSICNDLGWNLISPLKGDLSKKLHQIAQSEFIYSEAMHGAILADIYRVPWKRVRFFSHLSEGESVSEFKWNDYLASIDINNSYVSLPYLESRNYFLNKYYKFKLKNEIIKKLSNQQENDFVLSSDEKINSIKKDLIKSIDILKREFNY